MEQQKKESSEVKTHEEIMVLFKALESLEEKVKNPEVFGEDPIQPEAISQEIELPTQKPEETVEEPQHMEPAIEILPKKKEKRKQSLFKKHEKREKPSEKKMNWFSFLKNKKNNKRELEAVTELEPKSEDVKILRSTFILQLDNNGNLVGLPIKKPKLENEKKGRFFLRRKTLEGAVEHSEEEPAKGIRGKLKRVVSKLGRKKSSEGASSSGVGGKIKGMFRRKSKD